MRQGKPQISGVAQTTPITIRLDDKRISAIKATAAATGLKQPEAHRLALDYGLPVVKAKLSKKK